MVGSNVKISKQSRCPTSVRKGQFTDGVHQAGKLGLQSKEHEPVRSMPLEAFKKMKRIATIPVGELSSQVTQPRVHDRHENSIGPLGSKGCLA